MVDAAQLQDEEGTTLAELLVAMTILFIIGSITTVGLVQGFSAQLTAVTVAETLDGTRIATQRVRDFVRASDEVCASSTPVSLVLWTDDDDDGSVVDTELDIFELVVDVGTGDEVFQRRTPGPSGDETQLIRDDIINAALFQYDTAPADQPDDLTCTDGVTPTNGPNAIRVVDVQFEVENPDPAQPNLTTETSVRLRNAGLVDGPSNDAPDAQFSFTCPQPDRTCDFDASGSTDTDGSIGSYEWEFVDGLGSVLATATGVTTSFTFPVGDVPYDVTLTVTDDALATDTQTRSVVPVEPGSNVAPTAEFTFACNGRICSFDGSPSTDDVGIVSYAWSFGAAGTGTGQTPTFNFPANGDYGVTLTVTDADGASSSVTKTVTASTNTIFVKSVTGSKTGANAKATVDVDRTTGGALPASMVVSFNFAGADGSNETGSCTTDTSGVCTTGNVNVGNKAYPVVITVSNITNTGTLVYDPDQNVDDDHTVS